MMIYCLLLWLIVDLKVIKTLKILDSQIFTLQTHIQMLAVNLERQRATHLTQALLKSRHFEKQKHEEERRVLPDWDCSEVCSQLS
jgi:hypothetical protein